MNVRHFQWRERVYTPVTGVSRTQQSHAESADVNSIVQRFQRSGSLPPNPRGLEPKYMDVTHLQGDLTERLEYAKDLETDALRRLDEERAQAEQRAVEAQKEAQEASQNTPAPEPE